MFVDIVVFVIAIIGLVYFSLVTKSDLKNVVLARCGHSTPRVGKLAIVINGKHSKVRIEIAPKNRAYTPFLCLDCLQSSYLACSWCGDTIPFDAPVGVQKADNHSLSFLDNSRVIFPDNSTTRLADLRIKDALPEAMSLVACANTKCSPYFLKHIGYWVYPGLIMTSDKVSLEMISRRHKHAYIDS